MTYDELSDQIYKRLAFTANWYNQILEQSLKTLIKQGFIEPKCHVLSYSFAAQKYHTDMILVDAEQMLTEAGSEAMYIALKEDVPCIVNGPIVGMSFVAEGTITSKTGVQSPFMMITFEDQVSGSKAIYRYKKNSVVGEDMLVRTSITDVHYDPDATARHDIDHIEKFNRIMRPNYYRPNIPELYN